MGFKSRKISFIKDWDAEFCCDLAELMISSEEEEVESAGVPSQLRVSTVF